MHRYRNPSAPEARAHRATIWMALMFVGCASVMNAAPDGPAASAPVLSPPERSQPTKHAGALLALAGLDPVQFLAGEEVQGDESIDLVHGKYRYIFTTDENRQRFLAEPDRYRIQGDGTCPVFPGVAAHPWLFRNHANRIYAFSSGDAMERFTAEPHRYLDASGQALGFRNARKVAILLYDGVDPVDAAVPGQVFQLAGRDGSFQAFTVAASVEPLPAAGFVDLVPQHTFMTSPAADILVIPGGAFDAALEDDTLIGWVRGAAAQAQVVLSLSTGSFILARAGLLDGVEATTHTGLIDVMRRAAPRTIVLPDRPYVDTGKIITSPGGAAGIDACLHLLARLAGVEPARAVARYLAHAWQPEPFLQQAETAATP